MRQLNMALVKEFHTIKYNHTVLSRLTVLIFLSGHVRMGVPMVPGVCIATREDGLYIFGSKNQQHDPEMLENELMVHLGEAKVTDVSTVYCIDCSVSCTHKPGIHVYLGMASNELDEKYIESILALVHNYLQRKHSTECSEVVFFHDGILKEYKSPSDMPQRLHLRDAYHSGLVNWPHG